METKAASRNDDSSAATNAAPPNTTTSEGVEKVIGRPSNMRTHDAPITASLTLLANQHRTIVVGMPPCSSATRWAGSAAANTIHQRWIGTSSSTASKTALGGHSAEMGSGGNVKASPNRAA